MKASEISRKKFGFGLMRLPVIDPDDRGSIDIEATKKMVDIFISHGFTYFDTAWMYHNFKSEPAVPAILSDRYPRDSYTLATKLHAAYFKNTDDMENIFKEQLKKTGVDFFDFYLLHAISGESYPKHSSLKSFDFIRAKRDAGLAKHIGFSFHGDADTLERALDEWPDVEFVQLQLNYLDWEDPQIQSRRCYEICVEREKPVVVMEPIKGGTLAGGLPDEAASLLREAGGTPASYAIRFAASLDGVALVLSGMSEIAHMEENVSFMDDLSPLTDAERDLIARARDIINSQIAIPCTGCAYCVDGCPKNIPIPSYFSLYNADLREIEGKGWLPQAQYYKNITGTKGKASDCIACGQCESVCPQRLPIIEDLRKVADHFE